MLSLPVLILPGTFKTSVNQTLQILLGHHRLFLLSEYVYFSSVSSIPPLMQFEKPRMFFLYVSQHHNYYLVSNIVCLFVLARKVSNKYELFFYRTTDVVTLHFIAFSKFHTIVTLSFSTFCKKCDNYLPIGSFETDFTIIHPVFKTIQTY